MAIKNKIVVIGCGRFGSSVANLASERGENVIVVDPLASSFERLDDNFSGYKVTGDATDVSLLEEDAYIETAREVAICTGDDNLNLFLAHHCRHCHRARSRRDWRDSFVRPGFAADGARAQWRQGAQAACGGVHGFSGCRRPAAG
jgi:siroheme synthase (precorrin-2 oxidase/ferrochelatase)